MTPPFVIRASGIWSDGQVTAQWTSSTRRAIPDVQQQIDAAWLRASQRLGDRLFDGPMCRLERWTATTERLQLHISPASYKPFYGTNLTRAAELAEQYGADVLVNPIGLSALVESVDGWLLLGRRNSSVAYYPGRIHPFAGSLEPAVDHSDPDVFKEMRRELREELTESDLLSLRCIGMVEDLALLQPELIFHAGARRTRDEIEAMLAPEEHRSLHAIEANRTAVARALEDADLTPVASAALALWRGLPDR